MIIRGRVFLPRLNWRIVLRPVCLLRGRHDASPPDSFMGQECYRCGAVRQGLGPDD